MKKRIVSLLLSVAVICCLLVTVIPAGAAGNDSGVTASVSEASVGSTFTVTLKVPGTTKQISDMSLKVHFDKNVFEVTEYTIPSIDGMSKMQSDPPEANSNGFFSATYLSDSAEADITFNGLELKPKFKVKDGAALGNSEFKLDDNIKVGSLDNEGLPVFLVTRNDFTNKTAVINVTSAPKPATGITLNKSELTLAAGNSDTSLTANVTPSDSTDTVVWSSNKPEVATVDPATGKVTAVSAGEAVITAKAGTKTATCTVSVTCAHSSLRPVAEKASNCTEKGWDAYKKCDLCGKLFDMSGNPISEIPYRALNTVHDFNTSEWGYKAADGHAHACRHNAEHHDDVQPHIRDHEGGATYDYAVKCSVCNYVIEPQLEAGNIRIEVPFKLNVKKTGEKDPGKETFKFAVERFGAPVEYTVVQDTVETNGEKTYDGKFIFTIRANLAGNLSEGFVIRQVKGNAEGWTYDVTKFYAIPTFADSYSNGAAWSFLKYDENAELDYNNPIEEIGFTNSYNAKKPVTPPSPQNNESPKTGNGSMIGLWFALLFVSGAAMTGTVMYSRKRKANNR